MVSCVVQSTGQLNFKHIILPCGPQLVSQLCRFYYFDLPLVVTTSTFLLSRENKEQEVPLMNAFIIPGIVGLEKKKKTQVDGQTHEIVALL